LRRRALIAGLLALPTIAHAQQGSVEHLLVDVGGEVSRSARGVQSYSEGGSAVELRLSPDGARIVFRGMRAGTDVILLLMSDGSQIRCEVTVRPQTLEDLAR
jgi:hypothetical protein